MNDKKEIVIPEQLADSLIRLAAETECSVEELMENILQRYMERMTENGGRE